MANTGSTFDYIVIGSGSAGAVVASRLTEDPAVTVLLLEAGPDNRHAWSTVPLGFGRMLTDASVLWRRQTEPEPALDGRRLPLTQGRIVGGSSAVNGMMFVRGFPLDYALWRQNGAVGWSYEDVLPFFRKSERFERGEDAYHGIDGPIGIEGVRWRTPLADAFIAAAVAAGIPRNDDMAGPVQEGVGYQDHFTWRGRRSSTWHTYLKPHRNRQNLRIVPRAFVHRILFAGRRAVGVDYELDGTRVVAHAAGEVILSAGALSSPQVLQLSGIGPGALLQRHGIPVVHDLPGVGENLMDHFQTTRSYATSSRHTINAVMASPLAMIGAGLDYLIRRKGPMTVGAAQAGGFAKSRPNLEVPDLQLGFTPLLPTPQLDGLQKGSGFSLAAVPLRPESRGHVRLTSPDPRAEASIALNVLSTENDRRTLLDGLRLLRRIASAQPFGAVGIRETTAGLDGPDDTDEALLARVKAAGGTAYHYSGTARMGTDARAVVDPQLKVHGIDNLRVIDASIMPTVVSGNTNAATIMIGERGADFIRASRR